MSARGLLKQFVRREVQFRRDFIVGTVLTPLASKPFDATGSGSPVWVVDVEIGSNRHLQDVIVKGLNGSRQYAAVGQAVSLRQNTLGRYDIIGPADKAIGLTVFSDYALTSATPTSVASFGFTFQAVPFEFYENAAFPGASFWNDGDPDHSFPLIRVLDADGNPVT